MYYDNANEYVGSTIQIHDYQLAMEQHYQCTKTYVKCAQFLTVNLSFLIITMTLSTWEISKISFYEPFSFWDSTDRRRAYTHLNCFPSRRSRVSGRTHVHLDYFPSRRSRISGRTYAHLNCFSISPI